MFQQTAFNIRYAYQNLRRGGLWTVFAVVCIAAGVSAVVALRSLGLAIGDTLTSTVRESINGDITLSRGNDNPFTALVNIQGVGDNNEPDAEGFTPDQVEQVRSYAVERGGELALYREAAGIQIAAPDSVTAGRLQFVSVFLIDPATFPPTGPVLTIEPKDVPIADLLSPDENVLIVSENFAESQDIEMGETVRVSGTEEPFTVVGIVSATEESGLSDLIASFFGFAYIHTDLSSVLSVPENPNRISIVFPNGTDIEEASRDLNQMMPRRVEVRDVIRTEEQLSTIADILGRLIVITGLGALIIGGVGIINTMLVMVRRRTMEIATLKTFGLRGGQIANLFVWEALLLGLLGSIVGILVGTALGGIVNSYGEAFLQQSLRWRFYPQAALYGFVLGMSVTVVFGVLPVLTAAKVRPAIVLRPNETHVPVAGIFQSIGVLFIVVISIGIMVGSILGGRFTDRWWLDMLIGLGGTAGALAIIGLLIVLMWLVVWVVSRLPAFGLVDLRLALRNMTSRRWRTATTLLALIAGMYALSSITFVSQSVRDVVRFQLSNTLGGNVLLFPLSNIFASPDLAEPFINSRIDQLEGVQYRTRTDFYTLDAVALDGEPISFESFTFTNSEGEDETFTDATFVLTARRSTNSALSSGNIIEGRDITPEDEGKPVIVLREDAIGEGAVQFEVGQILSVETNGRNRERFELEIIGKLAAGGGNGAADAFSGLDAVGVRSEGSITTVMVDDAYLDSALVALSAIPTVFVLDISFIDGLLQRLINQFSALPTIVGLLSLLAAAAIMANAVLLATLERRKQIGVLKAMGLKGRRVLGILLIENTLVALLGAGIGIGLSALNSTLLSYGGIGELIPIPSNAAPVALALVFAALVISWLATIASAGVITRERVINVLRYD